MTRTLITFVSISSRSISRSPSFEVILFSVATVELLHPIINSTTININVTSMYIFIFLLNI